jgi:rifampicin phosphotransferase
MNDVVGFEQIDRSQVEAVGGKGAHLGELSCLDGIRVPQGFCVTTDAFDRVVACLPLLGRATPVEGHKEL